MDTEEGSVGGWMEKKRLC